ncbi:dihydroorotate dehydrogenase electron transfer subunit [Chloroflexota bacterium]
MNQVSAEVITNRRILKELERFNRPDARNISGSFIVWLRCPEIVSEARPGQFVMVRCGDECTLPRPFSIHQIDNEGNLAIFYAVLEKGRGTNWLSQLKAGDMVEFFGPMGNGFSINRTSRNLLLIAGGIGIAPLYFLANQAQTQGYKVLLLRGASGKSKPSGQQNPPQHYPEELLPCGIESKPITTTDDGTSDLVVDLITPQLVDWADQVFACGPLPMYRTMARMPELKKKPVQVSLEVRMGCGLGVCYGCTVRTRNGLKQACKDGPVFELDDIIWDELANI